MRTTVAQIETELGPGRDRAVRDTYTPYLQRWREILEALDAVRSGVAAHDLAAQQGATDAYNAALGAIRRLDQQRVTRVVDAYGPEEARRALVAQGFDPSAFGL
jgi:hypothetical protein